MRATIFRVIGDVCVFPLEGTLFGGYVCVCVCVCGLLRSAISGRAFRKGTKWSARSWQVPREKAIWAIYGPYGPYGFIFQRPSGWLSFEVSLSNPNLYLHKKDRLPTRTKLTRLASLNLPKKCWATGFTFENGVRPITRNSQWPWAKRASFLVG